MAPVLISGTLEMKHINSDTIAERSQADATPEGTKEQADGAVSKKQKKR